MMKKLILTVISASISLSCMSQAASDVMLKSLTTFYENDARGYLPSTARFDFYRRYCLDYDLFTMSQDSGQLEDVKVIKSTARKNAFEVSFKEYDEEYHLTFICVEDEYNSLAVDNVIINKSTYESSTKPVFDYDAQFYTCYSIDVYGIPEVFTDFIWRVNIDGQDMLLQFDTDENGVMNGYGVITGKNSKQIIREFKGVKPQEETEALYSFKEYSQGSFTKKYEIRFNDDYDFVMVANGRSYLMVLEAPFIRAQE